MTPVNLKIISTPTDEAGMALGTGQFLGYLGNIIVRLTSKAFNKFGYLTLIATWTILVVVTVTLVIGLITATAMAYIATEDFFEAKDRVWNALFEEEWSWNSNPFFTLAGEAFPQLPEWISEHNAWAKEPLEWIQGPAAWLWSTFIVILNAVLYTFMVGTIVLVMTLTLLLLEAIALGVDGASFMWDRSITVSPTPLNVHSVTSLLLLYPKTGGTPPRKPKVMSHAEFAEHPTTINTVVELIRHA